MTKHLAVIALSTLAACGGGSKPAPTAPPTLGDTGPAATAPSGPAPTAPAPAVGHPNADLIPRAVFLGNPERANVKLSPDGKWLSWVAPRDGVMNVFVAPIDHPDQGKPVTAETARPIREYSWAYTSKHLLYSQDIGGDENFHQWRVDLTAGVDKPVVTDLTPFKGARAELAGTSEKQPKTLLIEMNDRNPQAMDVYAVDLLSGKRTLVVQNDDGFAGYVTDDNLGVRFAVKALPDGSQEYLAASGKPGKLTWTVWDTVPVEDTSTTQIFGVAPNGTSLYASDSRGRDTGALVSIDIKSKKSKVLAEDPRADIGGVMIHPTKHTIQAASFNYDRVHWKVLDKSIAKDLTALEKLDGGEPTVLDRTLDDKHWAVVTSSDTRPAQYYLWNRAKQKATFLFAGRPELAKYELVPMHPEEIKARDGLTLMSYLTLPAGADANADGKADKPVPMVLLVHGGPWARDNWGYNPLHQLLADRGYAVLSVNFRSSTGFGKKFLNAGNLQWGKAMHDDLLDAVQWAVAQGVTTADNVCIMGGSYGGYATLVGLAMTPDVFRCGVDLVGPSNLTTLLGTIPPYWAPMISVFHTRMGDPTTPEGKAALDAISPLTHAAAIKRPLIIFQGANDPRVKQAESEQIVAAMQKSGLPVSYVVYPDEGHGFARPENNITFMGATEAFLSAHLGGTYLPLTKAELAASSMQVKAGASGIPGLQQ